MPPLTTSKTSEVARPKETGNGLHGDSLATSSSRSASTISAEPVNSMVALHRFSARLAWDITFICWVACRTADMGETGSDTVRNRELNQMEPYVGQTRPISEISARWGPVGARYGQDGCKCLDEVELGQI